MWWSISQSRVFLGTQGDEAVTTHVPHLRRVFSDTPTPHKEKCTEKKHIAFIKVPKAASTTFANIFQRFGLSRNLSFLLPRHVIDGRIIYNNILPLLDDMRFYDIVSNHIIFNATFFSEVFPSDVIVIANFRYPLNRFVSLMQYVKAGSSTDNVQHNITSDVREYLSSCHDENLDPIGIKPQAKWFSSQHNNYQYDLRTTLYFIDFIDKHFKLVLIVEHMDESLVLMRRMLCWQLRDILYHTVLPPYNDAALQNKISAKDIISRLSPEHVMAHKKCSSTDYILYNHFNQSLWNKIKLEPEDFMDEVRHFRDVNGRVKTFCLTSTFGQLAVAASMWNEEFIVSRNDCSRMSLNTPQFRQLARKKLYPLLYPD